MYYNMEDFGLRPVDITINMGIRFTSRRGDEVMSRDPDLVAVIMAGGAGTRFWPLSTEARPKQFLRLFGERTLLQLSYDRLAAMIPPERILVLTSGRFMELVARQLPMLPAANIIGEPMRRDTSAAVALAALLCRQRFGDPVMGVFTSDHLIKPQAEFERAVRSAAARAARSGRALYTFGIQPTYPATGFGYLERGELLADDDGIQHFQLERFKEKPKLERAREYIESGRYYWNSGMFVWTVDAIIAELQRLLPDHLRHLEPAVKRDGQADWEQALRDGFEPLARTSIDFGVMEKAREVRCVVPSFQWSDVGGWLALEEHLEQDAQGNAHLGRLREHDSRRNLVFCEEPGETVALVGVEDLVVVRAGDKTLITHRNNTEAIKKLVADLEDDLK